MWGRKDYEGDEVNFEWPSHGELMLKHAPGTYLKQIEFKSSYSGRWLSSVKCYLSDGTESPVFEKEGT